MLINRRSLLQRAGALSTSFAFLGTKDFTTHEPTSTWRTFQVTTHVEALQTAGVTRLWMPAALRQNTPFQKTIANTWRCEGGTVKTFQNKTEALEMIAAEFPTGVPPILTVTSRVTTRNWTVDLAGSGKAHPVSASELQTWLRPTKLVPTDGIVKKRAMEITQGTHTDFEKARAIYEWVVENTYRNPKIRG